MIFSWEVEDLWREGRRKASERRFSAFFPFSTDISTDEGLMMASVEYIMADDGMITHIPSYHQHCHGQRTPDSRVWSSVITINRPGIITGPGPLALINLHTIGLAQAVE